MDLMDSSDLLTILFDVRRTSEPAPLGKVGEWAIGGLGNRRGVGSIGEYSPHATQPLAQFSTTVRYTISKWKWFSQPIC